MVIRPHHLWWLLPLFFALFLVGAIVGKLADKPYKQLVRQHLEQVDRTEQVNRERRQLADLIKRWESEAEVPFRVELQDRQFSGTFHGKTFQLRGTVGGHEVAMVRDGEMFTLWVDGEQKEPLMLPFALYTPYDHLLLIKEALQSIVPVRLPATASNLAGYQLALPPADVKSTLAYWLGPQFPVDDVIDEVLADLSLVYQIWYEPESKRLRNLLITLKISSASEEKTEQLVFHM